jgi:hypothetical protein
MRDDFFDKLIQEKAGEHEAPVPADVWANIVQKKNKKRYVLYWWMTGMLLLATIGMAIVYQLKDKTQPPAIAIKIADPIPVKQNAIPEDSGTPAYGNAYPKDVNYKQADHSIGNNPASGSSFKITIAATAKNLNYTNTSAGKNKIFSNKKLLSDASKVAPGKHFSRKINLNATTAVIDTIMPDTTNTTNYFSKNHTKKKTNGRSNMIIKKGTSDVSIAQDEDIESALQPLVKVTTIYPANDTMTAEPLKSLTDKKKDTTSIVKLTLTTQDTTKLFATIKKSLSVPVKHTIFIDASVSPFISMQSNDRLLSVERTTLTSMHKSEFTSSNIRTTTQASFAYTLALRKKIWPKISLGAGLQYSFIKENVQLSGTEKNTYYDVVKRLDPNNGAPVLYNDTLSTVSIGRRIINATNSYEFVSITLLFQYELMNKKSWLISVTAGTYLNISSKYHNSIEGSLHPVYQNGGAVSSDKSEFTIDLFAGVRFARRFGKKYQFFAEPGIRYSPMEYDMQGVVNKKYIQRAGLSLGVSWKLSK